MDPFEPEDDYFSRERQIHPIKAAPRPKAGFIPSKSEAKQCALLSGHYLCSPVMLTGLGLVCADVPEPYIA